MPDIVSFDPSGPFRVVEESTGGDNEIDWLEVYSEWKVWAATGDNLKYPPAFRVVGGDPISDVQDLGSTFFLLEPWKFRPAELNHRLTINGNIFTDPAGGNAIVPTLGTFTVLVEQFVSNLVDAAVARLDLAQLQEAVYLNTTVGDDTGDGTPTNPVLTLARAFEIGLEQKLHAISIDGNIVIDRTVTGWSFQGTVCETCATLDFDEYKLDHCKFSGLVLTGNANGSDVFATGCVINDLADATGVFKQSGLVGMVSPGGANKTTLFECYSEHPGAATPVVDLAAGLESDFMVRAYSGGIELRNIDVAEQDVSVDLVSGHLKLHSSCTDGTVVLRGVGKLTDDSGGSLVLDKLGFVGMPYDAPTDWTWLFELHRRTFLSKHDAPTP